MDNEEQGHGQGTYGFGQAQFDDERGDEGRTVTVTPTPAQFELLVRAAHAIGMSLEQYILSSACVAAEEFMLQQRADLSSSRDDQDVDFNEWLSRSSVGRYIADWGATG